MNRSWMGLAAASLVGAFLGCNGSAVTVPGTGGNNQGGGASTSSSSGSISSGSTSSSSGSTSSSSGSTSSSGGAITGLPCDVATLIAGKCIQCHSGSSPAKGIALDSYANVSANASLALAAMQGGTMPPGGGLPAADVSAFAAWVAAGTPQGSCGTVDLDAGPPDTTFNGPSTCTSGVIEPTTYNGFSSMNPGEACVQCHMTSGGPGWQLGGTVFALGHVPDGCQPDAQQTADLTQAKVVITDASGVEHTLSVNSVGNFHAKGAYPTPYTAKVTFNGKTRAMAASQTNGDCNVCHTDAGAQGAPGRIALPQ